MLLVRIIISLRKLGIQISGQRVEPNIVGCVTKLRGKFDLVGIFTHAFRLVLGKSVIHGKICNP